MMARLAFSAPSVPEPTAVGLAPTIETPRLVLRSQSSDPAGTIRLTLLLKPNFAEAGWIEFSLRPGPDRAAELCFFLAVPYRGRGLMREAARAAAPRALRLLDARAIRTTLPADAQSAHAVARSIGLVETSGRGAMKRFEKELCLLF